MNRKKYGNLPPGVRSLVDSCESKGDKVTEDVQVFLDKARAVMLGKAIVKIDCKPVLVPGDPVPYKGYTIVTENGYAITFLGPQLTGLATDVPVEVQSG